MYGFLNDYSEFAHENLLKAMFENSRTQSAPYGNDEFCERAREEIKKYFDDPECDIHFLEGGTQTNLTFISSVLRPHQGVITAVTGHINCHETGSIEATGHKVLAIESEDGKIRAEQIKEFVEAHYNDESSEHIVQPAMVYISNPTEVGTIYLKSEFYEISEMCKAKNLLLYLDGARLGTALCSDINDLSFSDIKRLCDAFYIGGTKMGALYGEALVISDSAVGKDFRYIQKQKGALAAKGFGIGIQFYELFRDGLYFRLAEHANRMANILENGIKRKGYQLRYDTHTNQIFPIFPKPVIQKLKSDFTFSFWEKYSDTDDVVRLCTSWATDIAEVEKFIEKI